VCVGLLGKSLVKFIKILCALGYYAFLSAVGYKTS
jgi:hypothetical protein